MRSAALGLRARPVRRRSAVRAADGRAIVRNMTERCENTIGQDTLLEFLATLEARHRDRHARLRAGAHGDGRRHAGSGTVCSDQSHTLRPVPEPPMVRRQVRSRGPPPARQVRGRSAVDHQDRAARCDGPDHAGRRHQEACTACCWHWQEKDSGWRKLRACPVPLPCPSPCS